MFGGTALAPRPEKAKRVDRDHAVAAVATGLPAPFVPYQALQGSDQPRHRPGPIGKRGPGPADGCGCQASGGQGRDQGAACLQEPAAEQGPENMEEPEVRPDGQAQD